MDEEKLQFDSLLGGSEELPRTLSLQNFVAFRSQEIQQMRSAILSQSGSKLAFQTLPKHMRRRAMSHNVKRLPRRLRQIHINQMKKSGMPSKQKRPSRKYRRRPRNLTEEYTKRSNKNYKWLQTHIWHAKRFHMIEKWGYKLPHYPCDKAFRACYRAITEHCLLQDISYINCIEISGNKNLIVEKFKQLTNPNVSLSIGAKAYINGNREGELTLFEFDSADRAIGTVNYQWQPMQNEEDSKVWLWVHAAFYENTLNSLIKCFNLRTNNMETEKETYINHSNNVKLQELTKELCRFRLTGPLANSVLQNALIVFNKDLTNLLEIWLRNYFEHFPDQEILSNQNTYWISISNISSISEVTPHMVLSLMVEDPRINLPKKRTKTVPEYEKYSESIAVSNILSASPLWDERVREQLNEHKYSTSKIIELQSNLLIPGSDINNCNTFIPIILIQRPGNKRENIGIGSGWDVVIPSSWAKPFWNAFTMRGARAGGLREFQSLLFEMGRSDFLHPDTKAGMKEEHYASNDCIEKFFRKPPNKRINYNKFSIVSPFKWNWRLLIKEWNIDTESVNDFIVLKDLKILNVINLVLNSKANDLPDFPKNCLIPVKLECDKRGSPAKFAIICLPKSENDLKSLLLEKDCIDKYEVQRKELRRSHKILLKRLRRQRKLKPNLPNLIQTHKDILTNYTRKIRSLWLPEATTIRWSCSREVIGFVKQGGFSFSHGKSFATGYITANALSSLIKSKPKNKVLVRNTNTKQYRTASLSVIVE